MPIAITTADDPRVADYVALTDVALRRRLEEGTGRRGHRHAIEHQRDAAALRRDLRRALVAGPGDAGNAVIHAERR